MLVAAAGFWCLLVVFWFGSVSVVLVRFEVACVSVALFGLATWWILLGLRVWFVL